MKKNPFNRHRRISSRKKRYGDRDDRDPFQGLENTHSTVCDISAKEVLDSSKDSDKEILMEGKDEECATDTSSNDIFPGLEAGDDRHGAMSGNSDKAVNSWEDTRCMYSSFRNTLEADYDEGIISYRHSEMSFGHDQTNKK